MKKGILFSLLLATLLVFSACGESAEEKAAKTPQGQFIQTLKNSSNVPEQSTYTTTFGVTDINIDSTDPSAASINLLKDIKFSMTTSTDEKTDKSETKLNVTSFNSLLPISLDLDFLVNTKTGDAFIPLKSIVEPDESLLSYLDQATNGMWSKLNTQFPDLKNKYISTEELTSTMTGETLPETEVDTKKIEAASKDLNKRSSKLLNDYFAGLKEDRFTKADNGTISVTLTKTDIVNLTTEAVKLLDDEKVKEDFKVIIESQGANSVTDFETTYADMKTSLEKASKELKDNKDIAIKFKVSIKPGKDNSLDNLTLNAKVEDKSTADAPQSIAFKVETKAEEFIPIADFPTKDQIITSEEISKIISDFYTQMYSGMDLTGSGL